MNYKYLNILGSMSGTSLDGIDLCLVRSNGVNLKRLNKNFYKEFNQKTKNILTDFIDNFSIKKPDFKYFKKVNTLVTKEYITAISEFNIIEDCDLISFHGQTIFHNPKKESIQIGDGKFISKYFKKPVVYNFRENDIKNGGEGAPISPIYHKFLIENYKLELPSCILNIGGISNLTYWDGKLLIAFDTGPGNLLVNKFMNERFKEKYDKNGVLASKGTTNSAFCKNFLRNKFFLKNFPKSLDSKYFQNDYQKVFNSNLSDIDKMSTFLDFTIYSIQKGINLLPQKIKSLVVVGGGSHNLELIKRLGDVLEIQVTKNKWEKEINNFLEAEMIAYLGARKIHDLPSTFLQTTGTKIPTVLGSIYPIIKNL